MTLGLLQSTSWWFGDHPIRTFWNGLYYHLQKRVKRQWRRPTTSSAVSKQASTHALPPNERFKHPSHPPFLCKAAPWVLAFSFSRSGKHNRMTKCHVSYFFKLLFFLLIFTIFYRPITISVAFFAICCVFLHAYTLKLKIWALISDYESSHIVSFPTATGGFPCPSPCQMPFQSVLAQLSL